MKSITTIYKVYGRNNSGSPVLCAEFLDLGEACKYAVRNQGKIHNDLPEVEKHSYTYDQNTGEVEATKEIIERGRIYYMNQI